MKLETSRVTKLLKHDNDIERTVLHSLVHFPEAREDIKKLAEEDFYLLDNKDLFILLRDFIGSGIKFDVHTVPDNIKTNKTYLAVFSSRSDILKVLWKSYLKKLKDISAKRKLQQLAYSMTVAVEEDRELGAIKKDMALKLKEIQISDSGKKSKTSSDAVENDFLPVLDEVKNKIIKTGFTDLDREIKGLLPGRVYVVGGIPTVGKTTFILNMVQSICKQDKKVLFASLEMPYEDVITKLISDLGDEDMESVRDLDSLDDEKKGKVSKKAVDLASNIAGYNLHFIGKEAITVVDIENEVGILGDVDIVFIDYLQKITPINLKVSRYEQISQISKDIKYLATKFGIPIVTVASINRSFSRRDIKKPMLSDFRDSGNVEYDIDVALLMYRASQFESVPKDRENVAEIIIAKQRQGKGGHSIELLFKPEISKFVQLQKGGNERKDIYG